MSSVLLNVSPSSSKSSLKRWRSTRGSRSIWAKRKCGNGEEGKGGHYPPGCGALQSQSLARPRTSSGTGNRNFGHPDPSCRLRRGSAPCDHREAQCFVHERILHVQDLQSAWLLLLLCANARAMCSLRGIPPSETAQFAVAHDDATWSCFTTLSGLPFGTERQDLASIPFASGGCGAALGNEVTGPAHWASWADGLRMVSRRHPAVADTRIRCLSDP